MKTYDSITVDTDDLVLVEAAKTGSTPAFAALYGKYVDAIYRFCFWQTNLSVDAEDLTQNVFVEMAKSLPSFKGQGNFRNWLYTIAKRQVTAWVRQKYQLPLDPLFENIAADDTWIDPHNEHRKEELVKKLLTGLSDAERKVVQWRYLRGASVAETAQKLNLSLSNVKVLCHRALEKLRRVTDTTLNK